MNTPSIARKIFKRLALYLMLLWFAALIGVAWVVQYESEEIFDGGMQETAQRLLSLSLIEMEDGRHLGQTDPTHLISEHDEYLTYQLLDKHGQVLLRSHKAPQQAFQVPLKTGFYNLENQKFYAEISGSNEYIIVLAENPGHRISTLLGILKYLFAPMLLLMPLTALAIKISLKEVSKSIDRLNEEISSRDAKDLRSVDLKNIPTELADLGRNVNELIKRLSLAIESERNFTANSAHELRTPIAVAMSQLDVLRQDISSPAMLSRLDEARSRLKHLEKVTEKLMQLARAESGMVSNIAQTDLSQLLEMLVRDARFRSSRAITLKLPSSPVIVNADVDAIGIVINNLIENSDRYGSPDSAMEIELDTAGALVVRNDCQSLSPEFISSIFDRFKRGNASRIGAGIGLSIVRALIEQSGGELFVRSPCYPNNRGFEIKVIFNRPPLAG